MNLTNTQKQWLEKADSDQMKQFAAKGPAHVNQVFNTGTHKVGFVAMLRGLRGDPKAFETAAEALECANGMMEGFDGDIGHLPPLDEVALGIDGKNAGYVELFDEHSLEIGEVIHLASFAVISQHTSRFNDYDSFMDAVLFDDKPHDSIELLRPEYLDEIDEDVNEDEQYSEMFCDHINRHGYYGFALYVKTPQRTYRDNPDDGYSFSFGICYATWVYAETYEQAVNLAVEWAKERAEHDKSKVGQEA